MLIAVGVLIAAHTSRGISYEDNLALVLVVLVLSFLNLILKPVLILFTFPFVILSLGFGVWVINALLLRMADGLVMGFTVASWGAAFWGALVISLTSLAANLFLGRSGMRINRASRRRRNGRYDRDRGDDVIDI